jgi:ABC-2 type transport system ATP-binding protein
MVEATDIWKKFRLQKDRADSVGQLLFQMLPRRRKEKPETFWALQGISFDLPDGKSLGIVGNNGSGKSTLLKILTRTMQPTKGHFRTTGRTSALIELGAGFHPDFTGRENVYLNASLLGIRRAEVDRKIDGIIEFAELAPFIDVAVKYYSSGMYARLGFAVATSVEPDILVVDEVLAVGDEAFAQKCMDRILKMKGQGVSILLVSHDLGSVERLMDRAIWIDKGVLKAAGKPREVVLAYRDSMGQARSPTTLRAEKSDRSLQLREWTLSSNGKRVTRLQSGDPLTVQLTWYNEAAPFDGDLKLSLRRPDGLDVVVLSSRADAASISFPQGTSTVSVEATALHLASGRYDLHLLLQDATGARLFERHPLAELTVQAREKNAGVLLVPHIWRIN